jgi:hypothetical protein
MVQMNQPTPSARQSLAELKKRLSQPDRALLAPPTFSANFGTKKAKKPLSHSQFYRVVTLLFILFFILVGAMMYLTSKNTGEKASTNTIVSQRQTEDGAARTRLLSDAITGGELTNATKTRVNKETVLSKDWLKKNFAVRAGSLDAEGVCVQPAVCGPLADPDSDGLINILEYNFGTDPNNPDTDNDGISDGDELLVYYSNPRAKDTDGDGDGDTNELIACTDVNKNAKNVLFSNDELAAISTNITLYPLHEPTVTLFRTNGGTISDIQNSGYFKTKCETAKAGVEQALLEGSSSSSVSPVFTPEIPPPVTSSSTPSIPAPVVEETVIPPPVEDSN